MRHATAIVGLGLIFGVAACGPKKDNEDAPKPTPPKVSLPPSPSLVEPKFVEKYADGSYTVAGLVRGKARTFGKAVRVKGVVLSVHRCPDSEPACDPPPHAVLVDDAARPMERLFVVGNDRTVFPSLEPGGTPVLEGDYQETDPAGQFVRMDGVLVLHLAPEAIPAPTGEAPAAPTGEAPAAPTGEAPAAPAGDAPAAPAPAAPTGAAAPAAPAGAAPTPAP